MPQPPFTVPPQPSVPGPSVKHDGYVFRDLDHDGVVAPFEDWRLAPNERARDLVARLSLEEKVGVMMHGNAPSTHPAMGALGVGEAYDLPALTELIATSGINSFITRLGADPASLAEQNNLMQTVAASTRFGIPVGISTDPRHHFRSMFGAGSDSFGLTQWPSALGFAAIADEETALAFGDVIRRDYRAMGIHIALSPQADVVTDPRWPRSDGTFGDDPDLVRRLTGAMVAGMQGGRSGLTNSSVAAVVKHWVGYGATKNGFDGHNYYGRHSALTDDGFQHHVAAFLDAFDANVSGVMPTYNIIEGVTINDDPLEPVGAGFSYQLLTELLRERHEFDGVILSDWAIMSDCNDACRTGVPEQTPADIGMPWGVEDLSRVERYAKGVNAGLDQIGGENNPASLLEAVTAGLIPQGRIDDAVRRILIQKFELGLFEDPFVDPKAATEIIDQAATVEASKRAQARSLTAMAANPTRSATDESAAARPPGQPLQTTDSVYVSGMDSNAFADRGIAVAADPAAATVAVVRLDAPYETLHPNFFFGRMQHEGDLDFKDDDPRYQEFVSISQQVPTIAIVHLDRPAIIDKIADKASLVLGEYGVADDVLVATLLGEFSPEGRLPISAGRAS